jgi:hypothetical protein
MKTLLLDLTQWDLLADAGGNIAVATVPYERAQDVASALRTFLGEVWYDTSLGIPYFQQILGHTPPVTLFQELLSTAAKTVPGIVTATCTIQGFEDRRVTGQVVCTDIDSRTFAVSLQ